VARTRSRKRRSGPQSLVGTSTWPRSSNLALRRSPSPLRHSPCRRSAVELSEEAGEDPDEALKAIADLLVVFTKAYVRHDLGSKRTYVPGTAGFITRIHTNPHGEITHLDVRLPDDEFLPEVPVDYFKA
jgi:hypothetical protein